MEAGAGKIRLRFQGESGFLTLELRSNSVKSLKIGGVNLASPMIKRLFVVPNWNIKMKQKSKNNNMKIKVH
jgi:hypothetical protein